MFKETVTKEQKDAIACAPNEVTNQQLADDLGLHRNTIRKYRNLAKEHQAEAARVVIVERVSKETPNALAALSDCVRVSHTMMLKTNEPDYIRECRTSAKVLLDYLGLAPEPDEFDGVSNEALLDEVRMRLGPGTL